MPNITQIEVFNKPNELFIPLASEQPKSFSTVSSPNNQEALTNAITLVEQDILLNVLGLSIYNELQTALNDLPNADQKWRDLVEGVEYDSKKWEGLSNDYSLLAFAIYYFFLNSNTQFNTAVGVAQINSENAQTVSPSYKLSNAWQKFITKYQNGYRSTPNVVFSNGVYFEDWSNSDNSVFVSLYTYLLDKKEDFGWDLNNFKSYENINTFNL